MSTYKPTIGIEIHAELNTKSKMFCGCKNNPHESTPNSNTCPVCLAHPGTLPAVNKEAVEKVLLVGRAIGGEIADYSEFDRKQYFYPDIPKAYQLSQYAFPFVKGGKLAGVDITRVHLEEDTARSQHGGNPVKLGKELNNNKISGEDASNAQSYISNGGQEASSLVDFNRAGVPLMELVTEPVIHDAKTAALFAKELQLLLRTLGVSDANMEKGEMRVEANISISDTEQLGTKVEVKNLNSFRAMEQAIEFEISRQTEILANNGHISQETRGWDENKLQTFVQRSKETAMDYRYFPDPDIPKYVLSKVEEFKISALDEKLPILPDKMRLYLGNIGLKEEDIDVLIYDKEAFEFFEAAFPMDEGNEHDKAVAKSFTNYLLSDIAGMRIADGSLKLNSENAIKLKNLMTMALDKMISSRVAKDLLKEVVFDGLEPQKLAEEKGLLQNNSAEFLTEVVEKIMAENEIVVSEVQAGKESALQYLVGQAMKATKGSADPSALLSLFKEKIGG